MVLSTLIEQVSKLIGTGYLVSALAPWLLFWLANAGTLVLVIGPGAALKLWDQGVARSAFAVSLMTLVTLMFLILGALLVASLTTFFKIVLQGRFLHPPFGAFLKPLLERRLRLVADYKDRSDRQLQAWGEATDLRAQVEAQLRDAAASAIHQARAAAQQDQQKVVKGFESALGDAASPDRIRKGRDVLLDAYTRYAPANFESQHRRLIDASDQLAKRHEKEYAELEHQRIESFADVSQVAPTDYGNALASAEHYVARVYGLEATVYWTRLQKVISPEFMNIVRDSQVRLDFFTAMTVLSGVYGIAWFVAMPQIAPGLGPLTVVSAAATAATIVCYKAAVESAYAFGQLFRSCFDLFRRELLKALSIAPPATFAAEREMWERLSRLMVYGQTPDQDLPLLAPSPPAAPKPAAAARFE